MVSIATSQGIAYNQIRTHGADHLVPNGEPAASGVSLSS